MVQASNCDKSVADKYSGICIITFLRFLNLFNSGKEMITEEDLKV
jgi:hypothetical protein